MGDLVVQNLRENNGPYRPFANGFQPAGDFVLDRARAILAAGLRAGNLHELVPVVRNRAHNPGGANMLGALGAVMNGVQELLSQNEDPQTLEHLMRHFKGKTKTKYGSANLYSMGKLRYTNYRKRHRKFYFNNK